MWCYFCIRIIRYNETIVRQNFLDEFGKPHVLIEVKTWKVLLVKCGVGCTCKQEDTLPYLCKSGVFLRSFCDDGNVFYSIQYNTSLF